MTPVKCKPDNNPCAGLKTLFAVCGLTLTVYGAQSVSITKRVETLEIGRDDVVRTVATLQRVEADIAYIRTQIDRLKDSK
jgi:hypothetical protein